MTHNFKRVAYDKESELSKYKCQNSNCGIHFFRFKREDIADSINRTKINLDGCGLDVEKKKSEEKGKKLVEESFIFVASEFVK